MIRRIAHLLASLGVVAALGWSVVDAEALIRAGDIVLVETAPVDPRSLMQGDYMRLAWAIERTVPPETAADGFQAAVVTLDDRRIASFVRIADDGKPLGPGERHFQLRVASGSLVIDPHSFLFQEGRADDFAGAKYGVFRVAPSGRHLLVGLARADGTLIGPR
jgi:uncharacterized membrane-anchored protein